MRMFTVIVLPVFLFACGGSNASTATTSADGSAAAKVAGGFDCAAFSDDLIAAYAASGEEGLKPEHKPEIASWPSDGPSWPTRSRPSSRRCSQAAGCRMSNSAAT